MGWEDDGWGSCGVFGFAAGYGGNQTTKSWPQHEHTRELDEALYLTYYKDNLHAYRLIGELYNNYCLGPNEPPVIPGQARY